MIMMKKLIAALMALTLAAAVLCGCGKSEKSSEKTADVSESWVCTKFPEGNTFSSAAINFEGDTFKVILKTEQVTSIMEGSFKDIGSGDRVLYVKKQKQIKNSTNSTIFEKDVETSLSEKRPLYTKVSEDGKLTLNDNGKQIVFERE